MFVPRTSIFVVATPDTGFASIAWVAISAISAIICSTVAVSESTATHPWVPCHPWAALVALVAIVGATAALIITTGVNSRVAGLTGVAQFARVSVMPTGLILW